MATFQDITGEFKWIPDSWEYQYMVGGKFVVEFKDGTERVYKNVSTFAEVCKLVNLDEVENIFDI